MLYHNTFIIPPSPDEVQKYLLKWDNLGSYVVQEEALNDFYSTNIIKVFNVAKHIIDLNIDERLAINDVT